MTDEEFDKYSKERFKTLTDYYDTRAKQNKVWHRGFSIFIIAASGALVPLVSTGLLTQYRLLGGFVSASVVIATAISAHFQFNENWLVYRATWDALQREPYLRAASIGEYAETTDRNALFVQRVEAIVSEQGSEWLSRHKRVQERPLSQQDSAAPTR